ncbi:hypothetical protein EDB84DRAFT_902573 [Lactarius hengduanensis]|nr:hypothetical protein EDB84DRAFT_902573 [Lactarius hengduanensis]
MYIFRTVGWAWLCILYLNCYFSCNVHISRLSLSQYCLRYACIPIVLCTFDPIAATVVRLGCPFRISNLRPEADIRNQS